MVPRNSFATKSDVGAREGGNTRAAEGPPLMPPRATCGATAKNHPVDQTFNNHTLANGPFE